jgi:Flp pilus assembly protein TadB
MSLLTPDELALLAKLRDDPEAAAELRRVWYQDEIADALAVHQLDAAHHPELAAVLEAVARIAGGIVQHSERNTELVRLSIVRELEKIDAKVDGLSAVVGGESQRLNETRDAAATYTQETGKSLRDELAGVRGEVAQVRALSTGIAWIVVLLAAALLAVIIALALFVLWGSALSM